MVTRRSGPFGLTDLDAAKAPYPPPTNWNGTRLPVVTFRGQPWAVKSAEPDALQRELFVHSLARGLVNVAELRALRAGQVGHLRSLGVAAPGSVPANTLITRLAQSYSVDDLPQRSLNEAAAGELVFSLWVRRRDADVWNRSYTGAQLPVFYDLAASLDFDHRLRSIDRFFANDKYGYAGSWRVRVRPPEQLDTVRLREARDHGVFVDDIDGFVDAVRAMRDRIASTRFEIRRLLLKAGYSPVHVDELEDFLRGTTSSLEADTEKLLEVVLQ